ncbi:MAG: hypothetical protein K8R58_07560 [Bacteroidales bacterium]|nr:hypothetical protein [Bacteroidales bacterium]
MEIFVLFVPLIIAAISFTFNVWNNIRELNYKKEVLEESKISDKRKELAKKLNEFYGPFLQNLKKSTTLYRALTFKRGDFRLLDYLLDENTFSEQSFDENDRTLINEIVDIGKEQQALIKSQGGLIDDPVLTLNFVDNEIDEKFDQDRRDLQNIGLIPRVNAHYRILELARDKKIFGDVSRFQDYRFPRNLPNEIERRIKELQTELESLRKIIRKCN